MNNDAERYMANLQNQLSNEMALNTKQLNDSIDKCVSEYAKQKGISVVLDKRPVGISTTSPTSRTTS